MRKPLYALSLLVLMGLSYWAGHRHSQQGTAQAAGGAHRVLYYVDPMHPAYKSDKPGIAPDCGMQLEPVYADGVGAAKESAALRIDPEKQQMIGVRLSPVESSSGMHEIRLTGRVAVDETRVYRVNSGAEGWVEETFKDSVGTRVSKGQKLASFYSRELWTAEQGLVAGTYGNSPLKEPGQATQAAVDRLRNLGVSEEQIRELSQNRKASTTAYIAAPADGFILARNISVGEKFDRGMEFYRIADLRRVWIVADVAENAAEQFRPGTVAEVKLATGCRMQARVSDVLPQVDPATRTMKLRLEADNPGFVLRPDMFVDVELSSHLPGGLSVPEDALVDSGTSKRVYVASGPGMFEPRAVETGWHSGGRVQITSGLAAGEQVVSAGTFLVDSESKLEAVPLRNAAAPAEKPAMAKHAMKPMRDDAKAELKPAMAAAKEKDPRCGMDVDPAKAEAAGHKFNYNGKTYHFCSEDCRDEFKKNPEKYLKPSHEMAGVMR